MFIAYIILGIAAGLVAAITTLVAGAGVLMAFAAYVLGGMAGISAALLWMLLPRGGSTPQPVAQRG